MTFVKHYRVVLAVVLFSLLSAPSANAQIGWQWGAGSTTTSTSGYDVISSAIDTFGNTFAVGFIPDSISWFGSYEIVDSNNARQVILTKIDASGHIAWAIGTQHTSALPKSITTDLEGNVYLFATYDSFFIRFGNDTAHSSASQQTFVTKVSPSGTVLWIKNMPYNMTPTSIVTDEQNHIYLTGAFGATLTMGTASITSAGGYDGFIAKFDSSLNCIWATDIGSVGFENLYATTLGPDHSVYVTGTFWNPSITFAGTTITTPYYYPLISSYEGYFFAKVDSNGTPAWIASLDYHTNVNQIAADQSDNIYLAGYMDTIVTFDTVTAPWYGGSDAFLAKYNSAGHAEWVRTVGGTGGEAGYGVAVSPCGKVIFAGSLPPITSTIYTAHVGLTGSLIDPLHASDPAFYAVFDVSGNYLLGAVTLSGTDDYLGVQADKYGNFWTIGDYTRDTLIFGPDTLKPIGLSEMLMVGKYFYDTAACVIAPSLDVRQPEAHIAGISIYPNPAHSVLTIAATQGGEVITDISVANLLGQTIYHQQSPITCRLSTIDVAAWPSGMYLVHVNGGEVKKFVKE